MPAKVTTAFADTLSPIPFPKRVQPAAENFVSLNIPETIWGLWLSLRWHLKLQILRPSLHFTKVSVHPADLDIAGACLPCSQGRPDAAFQQFCLIYGPYSTFELCQAQISLSMSHVQESKKLMCPYFTFAELQSWAIILICIFTLLGFILLLLLCFLVSGPFAVLPLTRLQQWLAIQGAAGGTFRHIHKEPSGTSTWHAREQQMAWQILLQLLPSPSRTCA